MLSLSQRLLRSALAVFAAAYLAACATLVNGPVYDAAIEDGLNSYHRDATAFITRTLALGAAGSYDSPDSLAFYSGSAGLLNNLSVRADASDSEGTCAPSRLAASGLDGVIAGLGEIEELAPEDESDLSRGSCLAISLKAVIVSHGVLERLHRHRNALRPVTARIAQDRIDQTVRLALIQVRAAKP